MNTSFTITDKAITIADIDLLMSSTHSVTIDADTLHKVDDCRQYLERKLDVKDAAYYGINTGFGSLCNVKISREELDQLQLNLVRSHACGMGDVVPADLSRLILFLKIKNMSLGHSGIRKELLERMVTIYNKGTVPTIYELGSLGASGDLAPLAHLGLTIIGEDPKNDTGAFALKEKEGLAILNGTQFSTAYGVYCVILAEKLYLLANQIAALSLEAFLCDETPFHDSIHTIRPHAGQIHVAKQIQAWRKGSELLDLPRKSVQDPYSFRCIPQVHGATYDAISFAKSTLEVELNSVTDNPLIFPDLDLIMSGGNFHAQPIAMVLDYLTIAISELGSISERRIYQLINGDRGLPQFLVDDAGLNSGFMITQYTAASIASQNKQYTTPASADSIISCKGQEDHVSMAANAATKCLKVVKNLERILSLELLVAAQALDYRRPHRSSQSLENLMSEVRFVIPRYTIDRLMHTDIEAVQHLVSSMRDRIKI